MAQQWAVMKASARSLCSHHDQKPVGCWTREVKVDRRVCDSAPCKSAARAAAASAAAAAAAVDGAPLMLCARRGRAGDCGGGGIGVMAAVSMPTLFLANLCPAVVQAQAACLQCC